MNNFFGVDSNSSGSLWNSYFGNTSNNANSLSLGDYSMIKSGSYKKLLKKYYAENPEAAKPAAGGATSNKAVDSTTNLLSTKTSADSLKNTAKDLTELDYDKADRGDVLKKVQSFVKEYNTLLDSMQNIESVALLQNAVWMTGQTKKNTNVLSDLGITVGTDNKLKIDEKAFNEANLSAVKSAFSGKNSLVGAVEQRANQMYKLAGTQALINQRASSYTKEGSYTSVTYSQLFNSLL